MEWHKGFLRGAYDVRLFLLQPLENIDVSPFAIVEDFPWKNTAFHLSKARLDEKRAASFRSEGKDLKVDVKMCENPRVLIMEVLPRELYYPVESFLTI